MNNLIKVIITGAVSAVVAFLVLILSGLGTYGYADANGIWVSMTTVNLVVTQFGVIMILTVFLAATITGYALNSIEKK
jgi:hypothetical protein